MSSTQVWLADILERISIIAGLVEGFTRDEFLATQATKDGVLYSLLVIGEAAANVPEQIRENHSSIEWRKIVGMRNLIAHQYWRTDYKIVWDVVQNDLPKLRREVQLIVAELKTDFP